MRLILIRVVLSKALDALSDVKNSKNGNASLVPRPARARALRAGDVPGDEVLVTLTGRNETLFDENRGLSQILKTGVVLSSQYGIFGSIF